MLVVRYRGNDFAAMSRRQQIGWITDLPNPVHVSELHPRFVYVFQCLLAAACWCLLVTDSVLLIACCLCLLYFYLVLSVALNVAQRRSLLLFKQTLFTIACALLHKNVPASVPLRILGVAVTK